MICPHCGNEQAEGLECGKCGVVFAKWQEHQARVREGHVPPIRAWWDRPVGRISRTMRVLAGIFALGLAALLFLNGAALRSFGPYVALVFFVAAGLYFLATLRETQRVARFILEAAIIVLASATTYLALPEVFSLEQEMYESSGHLPMPSAAGGFVDDSRDKVLAVRRFLDAAEVADAEALAALTRELDLVVLRSAFQQMPKADQERTQGILLRLSALSPILGTLVERAAAELPNGPAVWVPAAVASEIRRQIDAAERDIARVEANLAAEVEAIRQAARK